MTKRKELLMVQKTQMTEKEQLLMVQVCQLQHLLDNSEYAVQRWRKASRLLYDYLAIGDIGQDEGKEVMEYFRETYKWDNVERSR